MIRSHVIEKLRRWADRLEMDTNPGSGMFTNGKGVDMVGGDADEPEGKFVGTVTYTVCVEQMETMREIADYLEGIAP